MSIVPEIENKESSIYIETSKIPTKNLLIIFGGLAMGLPFPVFEFFNSLKEVPATKIFVRDIYQCWYTKGLPPFSETIISTANYLKKIMDDEDAEKTMFIGNSAGGFAALLFGNMLRVDEVHAFSPQTFMNVNNRLRRFDFRWIKQSFNISSAKNESQFLDLKSYLSAANNQKTQFNIYYDKKHRLDNLHGKRMDFVNFFHHEYEGGGHVLIKTLKENGELNEIIGRFFK